MNKDKHNFYVEVAGDVGVNASVIFSNIAYNISQNIFNGSNLKDGKYWTYDSVTKILEKYPYMTISQIRTSIKRLLESKYIVIGNYNNAKYDKTKWYALTAKGEEYLEKAALSLICHQSQIDLSPVANAFVTSSKPIPNKDTNKETNINNSCASEMHEPIKSKEKKKDLAEEYAFEEFWKYYPRNEGKKTARAKFILVFRNTAPGKRDELQDRIGSGLVAHMEIYKKEKGEDFTFFPHATSWLNQERWEDYL